VIATNRAAYCRLCWAAAELVLTRAAIHAMLRATADEVTRPGAPHGCMLILAAPTRATENSGVREFLAGLRRDMLDTIRDRLTRGIADGDLTVSPASLDAIARYNTTLVQGLSVQARDGVSRADLEAVVTCAMATWDTPYPPTGPGHRSSPQACRRT
jgi:hypothetical protein